MFIVRYCPGFDCDESEEILGYFDDELDAQRVVAAQNHRLKFNSSKCGRFDYEELTVSNAKDYLSSSPFMVYVQVSIGKSSGEVADVRVSTFVTNESAYPRIGRVVVGNPFYSVFFSDWSSNFTGDINERCIRIAKNLIRQSNEVVA